MPTRHNFRHNLALREDLCRPVPSCPFASAFASAAGASRATISAAMPTDPAPRRHEECLELSVEELLRRGRPLPPHAEMAIDDLTQEEGEAFLAAIRR